jgi:hypothetical protein
MVVNKLHIKQLFILFISSCLSACAATPSEPGNDSYAMESPGSDCISQSTIRDYTVLDDSNLIVSASSRRKYHLVLYRRAYGLRSSWQIGLESSTGQVCAGFGDLLYDDGFAADRVRIASIRRLGPEEEDELLIRFGKKKPAYEQAPASTPVEGAEVEELD